MTLQISEEKMVEYRQGYKKRQKAAQEVLEERFQLAWKVARQGAELLKKEFGAERVVVFGSLAQSELFHDRSDIDLAVWGISEEVYLRALGCLLDLHGDFSVDLVRVEEASDRLRQRIEHDGVLL